MQGAPIEQGRAAVRTVRDRLLRPSPAVFAECLPDLERAAQCLGAVRSADAPGLCDLRIELREAEALFRAAGEVYFDAIPATYNASGCIRLEA